jgi:PAS domain S-box-containing protein
MLDESYYSIDSDETKGDSHSSSELESKSSENETPSSNIDKLNKSEKKYRQLVENSLQGIVIIQDLKIVYANPAFAYITGYTVDELLNFSPQDVGNLIHPDDWKLVWGNFKKRFSGLSIPSNYQFKGISKDGSTKVLELYAQLIEFDGKPAIQGIVLDITARVEAQKALEESEEKFRSIFENSGIGMSILTPKANFIKVNKSFADMFGYTPEEFNNISMLDVTHPGEVDHSLKIMKKLQQDKSIKSSKLEKKCIKKNGDSFWGFITITPLRNSNGELSFLIAQIQDITKRKDAEQKLVKSAEKLKELNNSKDKFFSIISHDLRSPFNALLGISEYTTQFFDDLSKDEIKEATTNLHASAKKVYNLMQNLLEWTQIQTGRLEVEKTKIDLCEISEEILELYSEAAENKKIKLSSDISCTIHLFADKYMIETVLRNLVSNAIKFTYPKGAVRVRAEVVDDFVKVSVEDTGTGIDPVDQEKLFSIGEQYRMDGTESEKGTGLGLILCKEFVENNGGTLSIESELEKGSKFIFTVPRFKNSTK